MSSRPSWRSIAEKFNADYLACQKGVASACDAALASPAASDQNRSLLNQWRVETSSYRRALALMSSLLQSVQTAGQQLWTTFTDLPASTKVTGAIGVVLALALGIMAGRMRALGNQPVQVVTLPPQPHEGALASDESGPANPPADLDERAKAAKTPAAREQGRAAALFELEELVKVRSAFGNQPAAIGSQVVASPLQLYEGAPQSHEDELTTPLTDPEEHAKAAETSGEEGGVMKTAKPAAREGEKAVALSELEELVSLLKLPR